MFVEVFEEEIMSSPKIKVDVVEEEEETPEKIMSFIGFRKSKMEELIKENPSMSPKDLRKKVMELWREYQDKTRSVSSNNKPKIAAKMSTATKYVKKAVLAKSAYQQFIAAKLKELRISNPNQKSTWYMKEAASAWTKQKTDSIEFIDDQEEETETDVPPKAKTVSKKAVLDDDWEDDDSEEEEAAPPSKTATKVAKKVEKKSCQ